MPNRSFILILLLLALLLSGAPGVRAQTDGNGLSEYQVKAAYLFNFAKFVQWPAATFSNEQTPLTIGILGQDPFGESLQPLTKKTVQGHPLHLRRLARIEDAVDCQLLFISASEARNLDQIFRTLAGRPVLTVGDMPRFTTSGGMVNLIMDGNRVRFAVNLEAILGARLQVSSKLLQLARITGTEN